MTDFYTLLRPLLHMIPAEPSHMLAIAALRAGFLPALRYAPPEILRTQTMGLTFKSPLGLAAGFDKNAEVINPVLRQGLAFAEAGTVTPLPQSGNDKPRIFRLGEDRAVINRLGFNNKGLAYFCERFAERDPTLGIAGANIGKNRDSSDAISDYTSCMRAVYPLADYITVNISSPNTKGLRDLQQRDQLDALLGALTSVREECAATYGKSVPLLLKIAPDINTPEAEDIAEVVLRRRIDGLIISNTTLTRPDSLRNRNKNEQGGLSGEPLFDLSTQTLRQMYRLTGGKITLVGVGGIGCAKSAYEKIKSGASLLQLYTALTYQGFGLVRRIHEGLAEQLEHDGFASVQQAVGIVHR